MIPPRVRGHAGAPEARHGPMRLGAGRVVVFAASDVGRRPSRAGRASFGRSVDCGGRRVTGEPAWGRKRFDEECAILSPARSGEVSPAGPLRKNAQSVTTGDIRANTFFSIKNNSRCRKAIAVYVTAAAHITRPSPTSRVGDVQLHLRCLRCPPALALALPMPPAGRLEVRTPVSASGHQTQPLTTTATALSCLRSPAAQPPTHRAASEASRSQLAAPTSRTPASSAAPGVSTRAHSTPPPSSTFSSPGPSLRATLP